MKRRITRSAALLALLGAACLTPAAQAAAAGPRVGVYDTGATLPAELEPTALAAKRGWSLVPRGTTAHAFKGDAVLFNRGLMVILRKGALGAVLASPGTGKPAQRARIVPLTGGGEAKLASIKPTLNDRSGVGVEATFGTAVLALSLKPGEAIVKTQPKAGIRGLRTEAPSRLGVLPDFFADDMVVDARVIPVARTEIPSENFFMNMVGGGDAVVMTIWDKSETDVQVALAGEGEARVISAAEVRYGKDGAIWVGVLEAPGIWHEVDLGGKKTADLEWKVPFLAKWKGNLMRDDHSVDSWAFEYLPRGKSRKRWSGVVGGYNYPCWFDGKEDAPAAHIEPPVKYLKTSKGQYKGATVIYPIDRSEKTPTDRFTVVDMMRNSLGMGPCEYIMDVAGQNVSDKGIFTCAFEATVPVIFDGGRQRHERELVEAYCREVEVFVKAIQDRINVYVKFQGEMLAYLAAQKGAHPKQAEVISRMEASLKKIGGRPANGAPQVAKLAGEVQREITADVPKANIHGAARSIMQIGLAQDNRVARCRLAVKEVRRLATIAMALDPSFAPVAKEVRKRTRVILRGPLGHEMR